MKFLNSQQLAFILDIKEMDAREKMVLAHCKSKGIDPPSRRKRDDFEKPKTSKEKKRIREYLSYSEFPFAQPIDLLAEKLNLPTLQAMVDDIVTNYLVRPATKKYILCDLPEKLVLKAKEEGKKPKAAIPPALKSMLPTATQKTILEEWEKRFIQFRPEYNPQTA